MSEKLSRALLAVDWNSNVAAFCDARELLSSIHSSVEKVVVLVRQIQLIDVKNPALPFLHEVHFAAHDVVRCVSLALYKPAVGALRSLLECLLYYCYFRSHPMELRTLVRDKKYYVSKSEIIDYFQLHVSDWKRKQSVISLMPRLDAWYSDVSAIIHGQIPGQWREIDSVSESCYQPRLLQKVVEFVKECADLVRDIAICSFLDEAWCYIETDAKRLLLKGTSADFRASLRLDRA